MAEAYFRRVEFVMEVGPQAVGSLEIMAALKEAGIEFVAFSICRVCDSCKGRAYHDDGPAYHGNDCIRRSRKCPDCDECGRPVEQPEKKG